MMKLCQDVMVRIIVVFRDQSLRQSVIVHCASSQEVTFREVSDHSSSPHSGIRPEVTLAVSRIQRPNKQDQI